MDNRATGTTNFTACESHRFHLVHATSRPEVVPRHRLSGVVGPHYSDGARLDVVPFLLGRFVIHSLHQRNGRGERPGCVLKAGTRATERNLLAGGSGDNGW